MYSTNTNYQQDGRQQAPNVKPDPKGNHYVLHFEDVITDNGHIGLTIYGEILQDANHKTPASRAAELLKRVIASNPDTIGEVMVDNIKRNQEGQR